MTHTQTTAGKDLLFQEILTAFNEGKAQYPESMIGVQWRNAIYFLHTDAENVFTHYNTPVMDVHGTPVAIVDVDEHNDLAIALYENKLLMCIFKLDEASQQAAIRQEIRRERNREWIDANLFNENE